MRNNTANEEFFMKPSSLCATTLANYLQRRAFGCYFLSVGAQGVEQLCLH